MIRASIWFVEHLWGGVDYIAHEDADPTDVFYLKMVGAMATSPIWAGIAITPYWKIHQQAGRFAWAVDDVRHTKKMRAKYGRLGAKFRTFTYWNHFPKHRAYALRGGARWAAMKVGSRAIPYLGWALFALDAWSVGKWIGEKTKGKPFVGAPWG